MEKKQHTFILSTFMISLLSLVLLPLFMCLGKIDQSKQLQLKQAERKDGRGEISVDADQNDCVLSDTEDLGEAYIRKLVFLGESTTYGLQRYGVLPDGKNTLQVWTGASCADGSVKSAGTLSLSPVIAETKLFYPENQNALTISEALCTKKPEYLVITLGLNNGASYYTEDEFKQCYRILLNAAVSASPDTTLILQSIFPVARTCKIAAYTPEKITLCNSWISDIAKEYGIKYLDTASALCDQDGYLLPQYDNGGDGIHLNESGLNEVLRYIRTHGHPKEVIT